MNFIRKWGVLLCLASICMGCGQQHDHKGKTPLVEVAGKYLYQEDLQAVLPLNLSSEDSTLFAERYIENWIEDVLLFDKAEGNIPDDDKIKALVDHYRRALIMHTYQEALVSQKLANEIGDEELAAYYDTHKDLFLIDDPLVKGLFIKVPLQAPGLSNVRSWYRKNTQDAIEKLEKYSLGNAVTYDYFYDHWMPVRDIAVKIPLPELDRDDSYLDKNRNVELKDTAFCYFLHVEEFLGKGKPKPLDAAKNEIEETLINLKRVEYINKVKQDLYRNATDKNKIIYYYKNSNE